MRIRRLTSEPEPLLPVMPAAEDIPFDTRRQRGLLVVDKPRGMTSHDVVDEVRKFTNMRKVGHGGTLDPAVTGVLPVGLGQATRLLGLLLAAGKTYDVGMRLHDNIAEETVREALATLVGTISQVPPVRSRVKRVERERDIYRLDVTGFDGRDVRFTVECEAGTYIRKLCHDLGETLGIGAHMSELRRTRAGGFNLDEASTLSEIARKLAERETGGPDAARAAAELIMPVEALLERVGTVPRVWMADGAVGPIATGAVLAVPGILEIEDGIEKDASVAILTRTGWLVAVGDAMMSGSEIEQAERGLAVQPRTVTWPPPGLDPQLPPIEVVVEPREAKKGTP